MRIRKLKEIRARTIFAGVIVLAGFSVLGVPAALRSLTMKPELDVAFQTVTNGQSLLRNDSDQTRSVVIWSSSGLAEFLKNYSLPITLNDRFFKESVLIIGFSDTLNSVYVDGFKHRTRAESPYYYLDLHDDGTELQRLAPPAAQKYSCWVAVSTRKPKAISNVQVREGIAGVCSQFGR